MRKFEIGQVVSVKDFDGTKGHDFSTDFIVVRRTKDVLTLLDCFDWCLGRLEPKNAENSLVTT